MPRQRKTQQLQIRVSAAQKAAIRRRARRAGMSMSDWVLTVALPGRGDRFQRLVAELGRSDGSGLVAAELNDLLAGLAVDEYRTTVADRPAARLDAYWQNYVAAMVEHAAVAKRCEAPPWTREVEPLAAPAFGSDLASLRLHLLTHSPPAFRSRNIFIDSTIGDRV